MKTFGLKGSNILVTGASGFLGQYIVSNLITEGAEVIGIDIGQTSTVDGLDITNRDAIDIYVEKLTLEGSKISGIVNNAAISPKGANITSNQFMSTMDANVIGAHNIISGFSPLFTEGASIVNIASIYGTLSPDFRIYGDDPELYSSVAYGASKAAVIQMTKYYAAAMAPIRFNTVTPGGIFSDQDKSFVSKYSDRVPIRRMAGPNEVTNAILFLLSPLSSYINGHNLVVDGGLSVW